MTNEWQLLARACRARSEENRGRLRAFHGDTRAEILRIMGGDATACVSGRRVSMTEFVRSMSDADVGSLLDDLRSMEVDAADPVLARMLALLREL